MNGTRPTAAKAALSLFHPELKLRGYQASVLTYQTISDASLTISKMVS